MQTDAPTQLERPVERGKLPAAWRGWHGQPWVARLAATLGIFVTTVGLFAPFVGRDEIISLPGAFVQHEFQAWSIGSVVLESLQQFTPLGFFSVTVYLVVDALLSIITLGGTALIPLLWLTRGRVDITWARRLYGVWLTTLLLLAMLTLITWRQLLAQEQARQATVAPDLSFAYGLLHLLPSIAIFPLGALLASSGLFLLSQLDLPYVAPMPRSRVQWAAALTMTAGVLVWLAGFYLMPEATTTACPPIIFSATQFAHGACAGLDSDQVMAAANASLPPIGRLFYSIGRYFEFLVALGLITAFYGWIRRLSVPALAWLAVWPALAFGVALVALRGVGIASRAGFQLTVTSGSDWRIGPGLVVTFAGIGLAVLGQLGLWRELRRGRL
jgi:hypothetical protein